MVEALDLGSRLDLLPYEIAALEPTDPATGEFMMALRRLPEALDTDARRAAFARSAEVLDLPVERDAEASADTLLARAVAAEAQLYAIRASTSWKLTAPLRAAVTWARGLRGR